MTTEPESKGNQFLTRLSVLRKLATPQQMDALIHALPPSTAELVRVPPLPMSWIHSSHWPELCQGAHRVVFQNDDEKLVHWGKTAMHVDLSTIFKMFLKLASPQFVARRAGNLWDQYNRNNGKVHTVEVDARTVDVFYDGIRAVNRSFWTFQGGVVRAAIEASGVKDVRAQQTAGGGTSHACTIRVTWS